MKNDTIYIARLVVETATPLTIGTGRDSLLTDRAVARDANGLPYIPGTSLIGVIRHELDAANSDPVIKDLFGFQDRDSSAAGAPSGSGSRVTCSPGMLLAENGKYVHEGLERIDFGQGYYSYFQKLPERDHVRITHKGAADVLGHGKFDEEVVHRGTRFVFELELEGTVSDEASWNSILSVIHQPYFRIGAGTRKGFGELNIIDCLTYKYNLRDEAQLLEYLSKKSSLNGEYSHWQPFQQQAEEQHRFVQYNVTLTPTSYFHFGAGVPDHEVDMTFKTERFFDWSTGQAVLSDDHILIPATSIKGAVAHRVAYHYNRLEGKDLSQLAESIQTNMPALDVQALVEEYLKNVKQAIPEPKDSKDENWEKLIQAIDAVTVEDLLGTPNWETYYRGLPNMRKGSLEEMLPIGENNRAVRQLFGFAKGGEEETGARGRVIVSDLYLSMKSVEPKVFNHVMIDRFTGGASDGALYQEKAVKSDTFEVQIFVEKEALKLPHVKKAFSATLDDIVQGKLPLGGNTSKGHGAFIGHYECLNDIEYA